MLEKLWNLDDLKAWLGYEDTGTAVEAIKEGGIPHFFPGRPDMTIEIRGAARRVRFIPSKVEDWAIKAMKIHDKGPSPAIPVAGETLPVVVGGKPGWRSEFAGRRKRTAR
jgi:hypothetical protein